MLAFLELILNQVNILPYAPKGPPRMTESTPEVEASSLIKRRRTDKLILTLAVVAVAVIAAFNLSLIIPTLLHIGIPSTTNTIYFYFVLFAGSTISVSAIIPLLIYQFRQKTRLEDAVHHYIRNKMQEIILSLDLVEANLVPTPGKQLSYEEKVEMLAEARKICKDVSGDLASRILEEARTFKHNLSEARATTKKARSSQANLFASSFLVRLSKDLEQ
jgi:hypothetical protein